MLNNQIARPLARLALSAIRQIAATQDFVVLRRADIDPIPDASPELRNTIARVRHATMTKVERIVGLCLAVEYVAKHKVPGDFVECGVWKGGSSMAAALTFIRSGYAVVPLHLFDTFEGMSAPTGEDVNADGERADAQLAALPKTDLRWAYSPLEEVMRNMASTGYPANLINYVKGRVEDTLPARAPERICILRLDTDWYVSTKHELLTLFPRLSSGGVLIIDDYGWWKGSRKAVDEYFEENDVKMLLHRLDFGGRIGVKQA